MVIDDSESELAAARRVLGEAGHEVVTGIDAQGVRDEVQTSDLVIIDFHLVGTDGKETLDYLKGQLEGDDAPHFILYTSDKAVGDNYRDLGFDGRFILKGNSEALSKQVDAAMRVRGLRKLRPE